MKQIEIYEKKTISLYFVLPLYNILLLLFMFKILIFAYNFFPNYYPFFDKMPIKKKITKVQITV